MTAVRMWPKSSPQSEVHAAFIVIGLHQASKGDLLSSSSLGQLELVIDLCEYAAILADMELIAAGTVGGYPGVFEYEVSDSFGAWYAEKLIAGAELKQAEIIAHIRWLITTFFTDDDATNKADLEVALNFQYAHGRRVSRLSILWRRFKSSFWIGNSNHSS